MVVTCWTCARSVRNARYFFPQVFKIFFYLMSSFVLVFSLTFFFLPSLLHYFYTFYFFLILRSCFFVVVVVVVVFCVVTATACFEFIFFFFLFVFWGFFCLLFFYFFFFLYECVLQPHAETHVHVEHAQIFGDVNSFLLLRNAYQPRTHAKKETTLTVRVCSACTKLYACVLLCVCIYNDSIFTFV